MIIYILPVSGGGFPIQLAIIQHLCEQKLIPDLTMASSGGNVAAYISSAADWKWANIERVARELNNNLFAKPWSSVAIASFITGFFQGNLYAKGSGIETFMKRYFTPEKVVQHEIWTGTYDKKAQKAQLFCNRSYEQSLMAQYKMNHNLTQSMDNIFANGDLDLLAKVSIASASIPGLVPPQVINGHSYTDGGNFGASPLTIMKDPLLKCVDTTNNPMHLIYINSVDLNDIEKFDSFNVLDTWKQATEDLIRSFCIADRLAAYEILRTQGKFIHHRNFICNYENLQIVQQVYSLTKYTLLEIYPRQALEITITNFTGQDTIDLIHTIYHNCLCRFWWAGQSDVASSNLGSSAVANSDEKIHDLLNKCTNNATEQNILYL